jgi:hypothetical protein
VTGPRLQARSPIPGRGVHCGAHGTPS